MRALFLVLLAAPLVASAQPAEVDGPTVHAVPFGSSGNAVELEVTGDGAQGADGLTVAVARAPGWLTFASASTPAGASEGDAPPVARLAFDVLRSAPVGETAEVALEVRADGAVVATHVVRLRVEAPSEFALATPYPNPARGAVTVPFEVPEAGHVRVSAFDVLGREVAVLVDGERGPGGHEARLDTGLLSAGPYVVRLTAGDGREVHVRRLTVVR